PPGEAQAPVGPPRRPPGTGSVDLALHALTVDLAGIALGADGEADPGAIEVGIADRLGRSPTTQDALEHLESLPQLQLGIVHRPGPLDPSGHDPLVRH